MNSMNFKIAFCYWVFSDLSYWYLLKQISNKQNVGFCYSSLDTVWQLPFLEPAWVSFMHICIQLSVTPTRQCDCCHQPICCGEVQLHKTVCSAACAQTHINGHSLFLVFPWLNSSLLTGRWQFSAWLHSGSHVSDCADDVCAWDIVIPALLRWWSLVSCHSHTNKNTW